jgi:trans-2,3-dihydro-3-hydroxyanthranilate isomerase
MKLSFVTADVFADAPFGGNPLAVFPHADGLPTPLMQQIAREMSLSETVFVVPPEDARHTRRLRIFTPAMELPFAGHPTVGTACVLDALGELGGAREIVFEEGVGPVSVSLEREPRLSATLTAARLPELFEPPVGGPAIAELLGLDEADVVVQGDRPRVASCGVPFLVVPLVDANALGRARLRLDVWERLLAGRPGEHVYPVTRQTGDCDLRVRMFAPAMGIVEDPATGAAASAVAGWLPEGDGRRDGKVEYVLAQGQEIGRPSRLIVTVERARAHGPITAVKVGGTTVLMSRGELEVP